MAGAGKASGCTPATTSSVATRSPRSKPDAANTPRCPPRAASSAASASSTSTRRGALCYLAAWDARRAKLFDRCAPKDGIVPFDQLVEQFMSTEPYSKAQRVFVIADNGSAHRGKRSIDRLQGA